MKRRRKKLCALFLSLGMILTGLPVQAQNTAQISADNGDGILAHFTFDSEVDGLKGGLAKAAKVGNNISFDETEAIAGKSLKLGGASFLNVTKADGSSLMTGVEEATISYFSKPTIDAKSWSMFIAPTADKQSYPNEHYLGALDSTKEYTVQRFDNKNGRPGNDITFNPGADWKFVTVVFAHGKTTVYVDGTKKSSDSTYEIKDILKDNSVFQIGKANWDSGEFFRGYIDDMTVYDHALSEEELADLNKWAGVSVSERCSTKQMILPAKTYHGNKTVTWSSSDTTLVSNDGAVLNVPEEGAEVVMTATVDGESKDFTVKLISEKNMIEEDINSIKLPVSEVRDGDITLPTTSAAGNTITWTSSHEDILSSDGKFHAENRPQEDTEVTLTAAIKGVGREFKINVVGNQSLLNEAYDALSLVGLDDVRGNLGLMKTGKNNTSIAWTSSNPAVITDSSDASDIYDGGVVTRSDQEQTVELTASISLGTLSVEKKFTAKVAPVTKNLDTDFSAGYLWTNFSAHEGYEKIFFGYSEDGLNWDKLNKVNGTAQPILAVNDIAESDLGVRDPHILRSHEGDKYWILGTDLHAEGGGAGGSGWNQLSASQNLIVWESTDLVNWSQADIVFAGMDTAGCIWAPEAIYDETTGDYVVYWSARDYSKAGTDDNALRVYVCRTRDFHTFTEPKVWLSEDETTGNEVNIIDTTIVKGDDNKFYRFSTSDWNTIIDVSDTLDTEDVFDVQKDRTQSTPNHSWKRIVNRSGSAAAGFTATEGYTVYKLPDGKWCAMGDKSGYKAFVTSDLASGQFQAASATFGERFRHGTVMRLSKTEEARVLEAFKARTEEKPDHPSDIPTKHPDADENGCFYSEDFEGTMKEALKLYGNAKVEGNKLVLDGTTGTYAELPSGWFDGLSKTTISFDLNNEMTDGNFFDFAIGQDSTKYMYFRTRGTTFDTAITTQSWNAESNVSATAPSTNAHVDLVFDGYKMYTYINGKRCGANEESNTSIVDLGEDAKIYFGKSFYSADGYFKGSFDNIKIYNRALSAVEIAEANNYQLPMVEDIAVADATIVTKKVNDEAKTMTLYVSKSNSNANLADARLLVTPGYNASIETDLTKKVDLTKTVEVTAKRGDVTEVWKINTVLCNNPVLGNKYADPDIDCFDGKYYIYPTTDGFNGWSGTKFHVFSSEDLVDWQDEGVILDLAANTEEEAGKNEQGIQIAPVPWSDGSAWAPSIEERNGKYYYYFCGNDTSTNSKAIGVAWADTPIGPFTVADKPLLTKSMCDAAGVSIGQTIDPSIYTEDDGTPYILFGNGNGRGCIAQLTDDMTGIVEGTMANIDGSKNFREAITVTKRDGIYHFTWSCDDTGSENYRIAYGISDSLYGPIEYKYDVLTKRKENDILGTGHHSVLQIPGRDEYYIAYHRFFTPLGQITSGFGYNRETCIDKITFDENTGLMNVITPTLEGITEPVYAEDVTVQYRSGSGGTIKGDTLQIVPRFGTGTTVTAVPNKGYKFVQWSDGVKTASRTDKSIDKSFIVTAQFKKAEQEVSSVKITPSSKLIFGVGEKLTLKPVISPSNAANAKFSWKSSASSVVSVSSKGQITAKKTGKAKITVTTSNGKKASVTVTVKAKPTKIKVSPTSKTLKKGQSFTIKHTLSSKEASYHVTYKSSKSSVAKVSSTGKVTAVKKGTAYITVKTYNGKSAKVKVTVK